MPSKLKIATILAGVLFVLVIVCIVWTLFQKLFSSQLVYRKQEKIQQNQSVRDLALQVTPTQPAADDFTMYLQDQEDLKARSTQISPDGKKSAYLQDKFVTAIEDEGDFDYTSLVMSEGSKTKTIFQTDYHLSHFEWLDNQKIVVYRSCGTECMIAYLIDVRTKKSQEITLGVGYAWSPNQQYVVAFHFVPRYGISVAGKSDGYQKTLLYLSREYPPTGSDLLDQTQVAWSPNSTKLAFVTQKESEAKLELLVFNSLKHFKLQYQQDLNGQVISDLKWNDLHSVSLKEDGVEKKISF